MKTLCEELIELFAELRDSWHPRRLARRGQRPPPPPHPPPELPPEDLHLEALAREFPRELFAQLLLELPRYRRLMAQSFADGDYRRLRDSVHQILGAAAYCQEDELEQGLRQLRLALKTDNRNTIEHYYHRAIEAIDRTLHNSGFRRPEV
jgi:hypothetical protein